MFDSLKNALFNRNRYQTHSEAVIVSCFYNPQRNPYRLIAFQKWYRSIKHLNHRIIECVIGDDKPQLPYSPYINVVHSDSLLWHKESLINKVVSALPTQFKYVFWVDADVLFTNKNWLVDGVKALQEHKLIQPFEFCVHLNRNQVEPSFDVKFHTAFVNEPYVRHKQLWRSFAANYRNGGNSGHTNYDVHGHVGFAWGARREVLAQCPLYDKALIGGADHIIAHAAAGQIPHPCIAKSFTENLDEVLKWSQEFYEVVGGEMGYVQGDLYHLWHGDVADRQYLKRIRDFTPETKNVVERDENGLHVLQDNLYMQDYYRRREVTRIHEENFDDFYDGKSFYNDMGYTIQDILRLFGPPAYGEQDTSSLSFPYVPMYPPLDIPPIYAPQVDSPPIDFPPVYIPTAPTILDHVPPDPVVPSEVVDPKDFENFS